MKFAFIRNILIRFEYEDNENNDNALNVSELIYLPFYLVLAKSWTHPYSMLILVFVISHLMFLL